MSSPETDSNGIKWLFAHGTQSTIAQSRDNPGDHRWSRDSPGIGKGYEVTWIISPTGVTGGSGGSGGHTALKCGGPNHSGDCGGGYSEDGTCCCWYDIGIRANGDLQFQTERPHPSNHDFDPGSAALFDNVGHEMDGHDTGLKLCLYPQKTGGTAEDGGIHIKFYINSNALTSGVPNNNWRLAADIFDTGQILGDGYDWPLYQEIEVRNSDTDESGFFHDSVYLRALTDADLQALRSGNTGGGTTPPPEPTPTPTPTPTPSPSGPGAVVNTTWVLNEDSTIWTKTNAENVIKDTLNKQLLPVTGVDFLNTLYIVIGPVDVPLKDIAQLPISGGGGGISPSGGTRDVNITLTFDLVFPAPIESEADARNDFQVAVSEEMIEVQTNPFPSNTVGGWFRPAGGEDEEGEIGDSPCDGSRDAYADGLDVEAYWSNAADDCIIPGLDDNGTGDNGNKVTYHGGKVMKNPKIYMIFWGDDWLTRTGLLSQSALVQDVRDHLLGTDSQFFNGINQYSGCGVPVWGAAVLNNFTPFPPDDWQQVLGDTALITVVADTINGGKIPLSGLDFDNTQFIVVPAQDALGSVQWQKMLDEAGFGAYHIDMVVSVTDPVPGTGTFPEAGGRHDCYKPTINVPHPGGEGTGGGTLPPDTTIPPPGATVINPIVSFAVIQVVDPLLSIIHASLPDWDGNNTITRILAAALIASQTDTDQFARFGPAGWSRDTGSNNLIIESPCESSNTVDNVHRYSDGLGVQTYWSNLAANCVVPGRGDLDLGNSLDIKYHGGRIMKRPLVVLIFWGPGWLTRVDIPTVESITTEVKEKLLDEDKIFFSQLGQYGGCGAPYFGASVINTSVPFPSSHDVSLDQARAVVKSTLQNGSLPTALIDFNDTWFCVIPDYPSDVLNPVIGLPDIGSRSDVFQPTIVIPGEAPEDPGGSPDPGDLETFSGVLSFKRDINLVRTSTCQGIIVVPPPPPPDDPPPPPVDPPPPPGTGGTATFYIVTGTSNQKEISNESGSDNRTQITEKINSSSSAMSGKLLKQADVLLKKESGTNDVTPLIYFKIWNSSNTVLYTSPTTFTPNELTTSFVGKTFDCSTNTHVLTNGDRVGCEWTGTDPDEFIWTAYVTSDSGSTGSSGSYSVYKEGSSYDNQTGRRCSMTLWT